MQTSLKKITQERAQLIAERAKRVSEHATFLANTEDRLNTLNRRESMIVQGLDLEAVDRGRKVIQVRGDVTKDVAAWHSNQNSPNARRIAWADAKTDIAAGAPKLRDQYIGIKNYSHFGDQREDHQYGFGPKHGNIVFSVRLDPDLRARLKDGGELTEQEIEDALYLLAALPTIKKAEEAAA